MSKFRSRRYIYGKQLGNQSKLLDKLKISDLANYVIERPKKREMRQIISTNVYWLSEIADIFCFFLFLLSNSRKGFHTEYGQAEVWYWGLVIMKDSGG